MITRYFTLVRATFNPFARGSRAARIFLSMLPPDARQKGMKIETKLLQRGSTDASKIHIQFKDGKEMDLEPETINLSGVQAALDRHSRALDRKEDLAG